MSLQVPPPETRADMSAIREMANEASFRGMKDIRVLSFAAQADVTATAQALDQSKKLPDILGVRDELAYSNFQYHTGLIENNNAHLFSDAFAVLPVGTGSVLVYGKAPIQGNNSTQAGKHLNGSLLESDWDQREELQAADVTFSPDPIFTGETLETATAMADILTAIVGAATHTQTFYYKRNNVWYSAQASVTWNSSIEETSLRKLFDWFTNEGQLMTGAGSNLEYMLTELHRRLSNYTSEDTDPYTHMAEGVEYQAYLEEGNQNYAFTRAHLFEGLRDMLLARMEDLVDAGLLVDDGAHKITFAQEEMRNYPSSLGLPEGSAVLRWNSLAFVPVSQGLDGIAPLDHFCYMPQLYYFTNTTLKTSDEHEVFDFYTSDKNWSQIVGSYRLGNVVTKNTHAVVLEKPMQYACALLVTKVQAVSPTLADGDGDNRTYALATGRNFPVTGIIIGNQFRQRFDFSPDVSGTEYYLYDNRISDVYLTNAESAEFRTLVLPSPVNTDVYFFLELRNDSNAAFTGAEGIILPGSKFYLAGKVDKPDDPDLPSVFMQDYFTSLKCTITSLENAHVSVPEMGDPQLTIGVQTSLNWIMSASAYVVLD